MQRMLYVDLCTVAMYAMGIVRCNHGQTICIQNCRAVTGDSMGTAQVYADDVVHADKHTMAIVRCRHGYAVYSSNRSVSYIVGFTWGKRKTGGQDCYAACSSVFTVVCLVPKAMCPSTIRGNGETV